MYWCSMQPTKAIAAFGIPIKDGLNKSPLCLRHTTYCLQNPRFQQRSWSKPAVFRPLTQGAISAPDLSRCSVSRTATSDSPKVTTPSPDSVRARCFACRFTADSAFVATDPRFSAPWEGSTDGRLPKTCIVHPPASLRRAVDADRDQD